jgi:hypothetical protein
MTLHAEELDQDIESRLRDAQQTRQESKLSPIAQRLKSKDYCSAHGTLGCWLEDVDVILN